MIESLDDILHTLDEYSRSEIITTVVILEQTRSLVKARLYLSRTIFIQVYANSVGPKCSYALIWNNDRMYGKDFLRGEWHGHTVESPDKHDETLNGRKPITLENFIVSAIVIGVDWL
jgi:hypothetical protein